MRAESGAVRLRVKLVHLYTTPDGGCDMFRVSDKVIDDLVLGGKAIGVDAGERPARKSVMPSGTVGDKRIPPFRAPALNNPMALDDEMRRAAFAQVLAHRQAGLTAADDERLHFYYRHISHLRNGPENVAEEAKICSLQYRCW